MTSMYCSFVAAVLSSCSKLQKKAEMDYIRATDMISFVNAPDSLTSGLQNVRILSSRKFQENRSMKL